jgi:hypothetical protein
MFKNRLRSILTGKKVLLLLQYEVLAMKLVNSLPFYLEVVPEGPE